MNSTTNTVPNSVLQNIIESATNSVDKLNEHGKRTHKQDLHGPPHKKQKLSSTTNTN